MIIFQICVMIVHLEVFIFFHNIKQTAPLRVAVEPVHLCKIREWSISASGAGAYHGIMEQMRGFLAFATHCSIKSAGNDKQVLDFRFQLPFKSVYFM